MRVCNKYKKRNNSIKRMANEKGTTTPLLFKTKFSLIYYLVFVAAELVNGCTNGFSRMFLTMRVIVRKVILRHY